MVHSGVTAVAALLAVAVIGCLLAAVHVPATATRAWLVLVALLPSWAEISVPHAGFLQPSTYLGIPLMAMAVTQAKRRISLTPWDIAVLVYGVFSFVAVYKGALSNTLKEFILLGALSYCFGRLGDDSDRQKIGRVIAVVTVVLGAFSCLEFLLHFNPYPLLHFNDPDYAWSTIQRRGGEARSEAGWGHSLALAGALASGTPFVLKYLRRRWVGLVVVLLGAAFTFSRGAILSEVLCLLLCLSPRSGVALDKGSRSRIIATLLATMAVTLPLLNKVQQNAGNEISSSGQYRVGLLQLIYTLRLVGPSRGAVYDPSRHAYRFNNLASIDNAPLYIALNCGIIVAASLLIVIIYLIFSYAAGRASVVATGVITTLPLLINVAFITQWYAWFWFLLGLAVADTASAAARMRLAKSSPPPDAEVREPTPKIDSPDPEATVVLSINRIGSGARRPGDLQASRRIT